MDRAYGEEEPRRKPRSGFSSCAEPALQKVDRPRYRRSQTALKQTERAHDEAHILPVINSTDQNQELASQD